MKLISTIGCAALWLVLLGAGTVRAAKAQDCPPAPREDCRLSTEPRSSTLLLRNSAANDLIVWKWKRGENTVRAEFGEPLPHSYSLCLYRQSSGAPMQVTGGMLPVQCDPEHWSCWARTGGRGFVSHLKVGTHSSVDLSLTAGGDGQARITVAVRAPNIDMPALPLRADAVLRIQLANADSATCWESEFPGPVMLNGATLFKGVSRR